MVRNYMYAANKIKFEFFIRKYCNPNTQQKRELENLVQP